MLLQESGQPGHPLHARPARAARSSLDLDADDDLAGLHQPDEERQEAIDARQEKGDAGVRARSGSGCAADGETLTIDIQDNGVGLPDQPERLFEPYVTTRAKGTGLGLPIVKKIVEEHDGTLDLLPAPVFDGEDARRRLGRIVLPQARARTRLGRRRDRNDKQETEREHVMTDILIVDDERDIRELIGDILEDEGYGVRLAWDSDTAFGRDQRGAARSDDPRHLAQGQPARRDRHPQDGQARQSRRSRW